MPASHEPLRVLLVEDEVLLLMQLEAFVTGLGHAVVGTAVSSGEALALAADLAADLALVDVHLGSGPTGIEVGRVLLERTGAAVAFMSATPGRIPGDFPGAIGVIPKPYTREGLRSAMAYIEGVLRTPPPPTAVPRSLTLTPWFSRQWAGLATTLRTCDAS